MARNNSGKKFGQKYKSYLVAQLLLKYTDEENVMSVADIIEHLKAYDIEAEHHSIVRDINDLEELLNIEEDYDDDIIYDRAKLGYTIDKGFKNRVRVFNISSRPYDFEDIQLISQCINSAKFVTHKKAEQLNEIIGSLCSEYQADTLHNTPYLVGRMKTSNNKVIYYVNTINEAISKKEKISFKYYHYKLESTAVQKPNRKGAENIVSPFKLIINEGNYYLLAYNEKFDKIITYRLDRMGEVKHINEPRDGNELFSKINMNTYTQEVFGMFGGEKKHVQIRFTNNLLDVAIDRFGLGSNVTYSRVDKTHFSVFADVEISDQFFSWVCGFRKKAVILSPIDVVEAMEKYIEDIQNLYKK